MHSSEDSSEPMGMSAPSSNANAAQHPLRRQLGIFAMAILLVLLSSGMAFGLLTGFAQLHSNLLLAAFQQPVSINAAIYSDEDFMYHLVLTTEPIHEIDGLSLEQVWEGFDSCTEDEGMVPWIDYSSSIESACIETPMAPSCTANWFKYCECLEEVIGLENLDLRRAESLDEMFRYCATMRSIDLSGKQTCALSMRSMFANCDSLEEVGLPGSLASDGKLQVSGLFSGTQNVEKLIVPASVKLDFGSQAKSTLVPQTNRYGIANSKFWYLEGNGRAYTNLEMFQEIAKRHIDGAGPSTWTSYRNSWDSDDAYGALYGDGTLVLARGSNPDPSFEGSSLSYLYRDIETQYGGSVSNRGPWSAVGSKVRNVIFEQDIVPENASYWFYGLSNLAFVRQASLMDLSQSSSCSSMFMQCPKLEGIYGLKLGENGIRDASYMFANCYALHDLDVSDWNASTIEVMDDMFNNCKALECLDVSKWDVGSAKSMSRMFSNCTSLGQLDLSGWHCSLGEWPLVNMFYNCAGLRQVDMSGITTHASSLNSMFAYCQNLQEVHLPSFASLGMRPSTSNIFTSCHNMRRIVIPSGFMFDGTGALGSSFPSVYGDDEMNQDDSFWYIEGSPYPYTINEALVKTNENALGRDKIVWISHRPLSDEDGYAAVYGRSVLVFGQGSEVPAKYDGLAQTCNFRNFEERAMDLSSSSFQWRRFAGSIRKVVFCDSIRPVDLSGWFLGFSALESVSGMGNLDLSRCASMASLFEGCASLQHLDTSSVITSNVNNMDRTFFGCGSLHADCSHWDVSSVTTHDRFNDGAPDVASPFEESPYAAASAISDHPLSLDSELKETSTDPDGLMEASGIEGRKEGTDAQEDEATTDEHARPDGVYGSHADLVEPEPRQDQQEVGSMPSANERALFGEMVSFTASAKVTKNMEACVARIGAYGLGRMSEGPLIAALRTYSSTLAQSLQSPDRRAVPLARSTLSRNLCLASAPPVPLGSGETECRAS